MNLKSRKAQTMGFIIIILISAIAVAGIFIGTAQTWKSMACYMGVPFRTSFSPHIGNLRVPIVPIEVNNTTMEFTDCYNNCMLGLDPDMGNCSWYCNQICPEYGPNGDATKCLIWDINLSYNAKGNLDTDINIALYSKPNMGDPDLTSYGSAKWSEEFTMNPGQNRVVGVVRSYIESGDSIGGFTCQTPFEGSVVMLKAMASGQATTLEENYSFCMIPHINLTAAYPVTVVTDESCDCTIEVKDSINGALLRGPNSMITSDYIKHESYIVINLGEYFHIVCVDRIYGPAYGRANEIWRLY